MSGRVCLVFCGLAALLAEAGFAGQEKPGTDIHARASVYEELTKAPEKARNKKSPLDQDPSAVAAGRNLFEEHCGECHGSDASGGKKAPSLRATEVQNSTPGTLFWILTNGVVRRGMPVWSKLPDQQRWQLVAYIKSLGEGAR